MSVQGYIQILQSPNTEFGLWAKEVFSHGNEYKAKGALLVAVELLKKSDPDGLRTAAIGLGPFMVDMVATLTPPFEDFMDPASPEYDEKMAEGMKTIFGALMMYVEAFLEFMPDLGPYFNRVLQRPS